MIFASKFFLFSLLMPLLIFCFNCNLFSQDELEKQFNLAKELYNKEDYFDSITELKRLLFFDNQKKYSYPANELIGEAYKMGAKFSDAIQYFTIAEINSASLNELFNSKIEIIKVNILRRSTQRALTLLNEMDSNKIFSDKKDEILYWKGWSYIFNDQWDKAAQQFDKISPDHELKKLSEKVDNEKYSVLKAKILSFIIPGAGQFYTKNYFSGIISFGWNFLWGYITINSFIDERVFDGLAAGDLLWLRFYRGNIQNAEKFALEKNREISNKALNYLQFKYNGEKP
jgi:TM2 domain-containing membrane protein YozV